MVSPKTAEGQHTRHIAIIGAGPGGYVAALRSAQLGAQVTLIERESIGGVCLNWGCIPTKTLLRTAEVLDLARNAGRFGVRIPEASLDWPAAVERKNLVVQQLVGGIEVLLRKSGVEVLKGSARFTEPWKISVKTSSEVKTLAPDRVIIAAGSLPIALPISGIQSEGVIDSRGALDLPAVPKRLLIIGGGAIGVEFASLFHSCGADVTLVEMMPRILPGLDHDLAGGISWLLSQKGVDIRVDTKVSRIEPADKALSCTLTGKEGTHMMLADQVLVAVGRRPNVEGLGLEVAGVHASTKGIHVNEKMETSIPGIFAIGDCVGGSMLAHVAMRQGAVAAENALNLDSIMDYKAVPACIFSTPEAASVGMSEEQARAAGYTVRTGLFALVNNGKAVASGETDGFVKIVADQQHDEILGLHILGQHASDLILEGSLALNLEATLEEIESTIHPHPTLGEALAEAALAAKGRALHLPASKSTSVSSASS